MASAFEVVDNVPVRRLDVDRALSAYDAVCGEGRGQTVFIAGGSGSGRTAFLAAVAHQLRRAKHAPLVLAGSLETGHYVAHEDRQRSERVKHAIGLLTGVTALAAPLGPVAAAAAQIMSASQNAWQLADDLRARGQRQDPFELVPELLRGAAAERPVLCLFDDADCAQRDWWNMIYAFAQEVAVNLPLLLLLVMEGGEKPAPVPHEPDDRYVPDRVYVPASLMQRGLARWWPLRPLDVDELGNWIAPAAADVAKRLHQATSGLACSVGQLWDGWQRDGDVVQADDDGRWRFTPRGRDRALPPERLNARLTELLGHPDVRTVDRARELLACAALEGTRFTAEAVARATGRERDELIDFLDDTLAVGEERPHGLVAEADCVTVRHQSGTRHLWRYQFTSLDSWRTFRDSAYGLTAQEEPRYALKLAEALEELYGPERDRVARVLGRLFLTGGEEHRARSYMRLADLGADRDVLCWRAHRLLEASQQGWDQWERQRAIDLLLAAAEALFDSGPYADGLRFADAAHEIDREEKRRADALYLRGHFLERLGDHARARKDLTAALQLWQASGNRPGEIVAREHIAESHLQEGDIDQARREMESTLELSQRVLGDEHPSTLLSMHNLAAVLQEQGDFSGARALGEQVLELRQRVLGQRHPETLLTMGNLASVLKEQGDFSGARALGERVLELQRRVLGDQHPHTLTTMSKLTDVLFGQGDFSAARPVLEQLLALRRRVFGEEHPDTLTAMHNLATLLEQLGQFSEARALDERVLELERRVLGEEHPDTVVTMHNLAVVLWKQGELSEARALAEPALERCRRAFGENHPHTLMMLRLLAAMPTNGV